MHGGEYVLMCSCCGAGVLRAAVKVIPEFVYSKVSACACVKTERFQVRDGQPQLLAVPHCPVLHHVEKPVWWLSEFSHASGVQLSTFRFDATHSSSWSSGIESCRRECPD
jgi:hypothetical protein